MTTCRKAGWPTVSLLDAVDPDSAFFVIGDVARRADAGGRASSAPHVKTLPTLLRKGGICAAVQSSTSRRPPSPISTARLLFPLSTQR